MLGAYKQAIATVAAASPSIFDRMLGFTYCPGPSPPPRQHGSFVHYNCTESTDKSWICFKVETLPLGNARVCQYTPQTLHAKVLSQKLGGPVTLLPQ